MLPPDVLALVPLADVIRAKQAQIELHRQRLAEHQHAIDALVRELAGIGAAPTNTVRTVVIDTTAERARLEALLAQYGGNKVAVSRHLGVTVRSVYRRLESCGLHRSRPRSVRARLLATHLAQSH